MKHIFISHATADDRFAKELREKLEGQGLTVWIDSRNLRGGSKMKQEIHDAIQEARQVIVVLSPNTINSTWVRDEIQKAQEVEKQRQDDDYRVIPLLLPGVEPSALKLWFEEEPLAVPVQFGPGGLMEALPAILVALGERLPDDFQPLKKAEAKPIEELILELRDPKIRRSKGERRVSATANLVYTPADSANIRVDSKPFIFTAPIGPIETGELRWYLERYAVWPVGVFMARARNTEEKLPEWGKALYDTSFSVSQ